MKIENWYALEHPDGEFPPGIWVTAGKHRGKFGAFFGEHSQTRGFLPEPIVGPAISFLRTQKKNRIAMQLADLLENILPDLQRLIAGEEPLVMSLNTGCRYAHRRTEA